MEKKMRKEDELLQKYLRTEYPQGLDMYLINQDMGRELAKVPHRPDPKKALRSIRPSFDGLKGYLPDFTAFKRRRSMRTIIAG